MQLSLHVASFLQACQLSEAPLLLALSGGPDSLSLFYTLLDYRTRTNHLFHVAHVDHGWRKESQQEAQQLAQLALVHKVPFHLETLEKDKLTGNLEDACRQARYAFFAVLSQKYNFQAVLTGHHQDDQAETILKRLFEGAHWSHWSGLLPDTMVQGVRVLRPFLTVSKENIYQDLKQQDLIPFEDVTNKDQKFLRARLRQTLLPELSQTFGKQVKPSLIEIGKEAQELTQYFNQQLSPWLMQKVEGPWGIYLDLSSQLPASVLEIKYLLRLLCAKRQQFLSRIMLDQAAQTLLAKKTPCSFRKKNMQLWIDRQRLFLLAPLPEKFSKQVLCPGQMQIKNWEINVKERLYSKEKGVTSWKEGWVGELITYVSPGNYEIAFLDPEKQEYMEKKENKIKIPLFLKEWWPCLWQGQTIYHEFLSGQFQETGLLEGKECWEIKIRFCLKNK